MKNKLFRFWRAEDGAVTVDWVVLTAAIVGLGLVVLIPIGFTTDKGAQTVKQQISSLKSGYGNN